MEDKVVDFIVAMDQRRTVLRLLVFVLEELGHLFKVWNIAHWLPGIFVLRFCLVRRDGCERLDLSIVESVVPPKI